MFKELLLFIGVTVIAFFIVLHFQGVSVPTLISETYNLVVTQFNPLPTIQPIIKNIQQNPVSTLSGIALGATPVMLIASKAYTTVKSRLSARVEQVTEQKHLMELEATSRLQKDSETIEAQKRQITELQKIPKTDPQLVAAVEEAQRLLTVKTRELDDANVIIAHYKNKYEPKVITKFK